MTSVRSGGPPTEFFLGDVLRLRKQHPCGGFEWTVVRLGADLGLRCTSCQRRILLPRRDVEKRLKAFVSRGETIVESGSGPESDRSAPDWDESR